MYCPTHQGSTPKSVEIINYYEMALVGFVQCQVPSAMLLISYFSLDKHPPSQELDKLAISGAVPSPERGLYIHTRLVDASTPGFL